MAEYFEHYPSSPDELVGCSAQLIRAAGDSDNGVKQVHGATNRAVDAVEGDLTFPMAKAPEPTIRNGASVAEAALFAGGTLMVFAEAVTTYNTGIDRLNARIQEDEFDVMSVGRADKLHRLRAEQLRLEADLDDDAVRVAAMLDRGPNAEDMAFLRNRGYLVSPDELLQALAGMPVLRDPHAMATWWDSLTLGQRAAIMAAYPGRLGNADGLPAEVRDEANRLTMAEDLERLEEMEREGTLTEGQSRALANIRNIMENIKDRESHTDPITGEKAHAQLYVYDPYAFNGDGRFAIATGNLDDADDLAVMVSGVTTDAATKNATSSLNVYDESRRASGDSVAVLDWVGYDAPSGIDTPGMATPDMAREGAELLASDVEGLRASRSDDPAHLTVIGHSYGSTTSGIAANEYDLDADDLVLNGSPGVPVDDAGDLTTGNDHTWVGSNSQDDVSWLGKQGSVGAATLGYDPAEDEFGAKRVQAEYTDRTWSWDPTDGYSKKHTHYYDKNSESLYNVAAIATGEYDEVESADHRHDPWYAPPEDPEGEREPREIRHGR
ncbi:MAG TPA: alpha/beta hydrolase [Nocardioidaceae bacterium]|nr:alpha/beta hydrolase [Nocardioidaceae bacterium]